MTTKTHQLQWRTVDDDGPWRYHSMVDPAIGKLAVEENTSQIFAYRMVDPNSKDALCPPPPVVHEQYKDMPFSFKPRNQKP